MKKIISFKTVKSSFLFDFEKKKTFCGFFFYHRFESYAFKHNLTEMFVCKPDSMTFDNFSVQAFHWTDSQQLSNIFMLDSSRT